MKRRDFLKSSFFTLAMGAGGPGFLTRTAQAAIGKGKILVVVQLSGGNDALNTLVPYAQGAYYAARPTLAVSKKDVLTVSAEVGLNPSLKPFMGLWDAGELALVQGVGYPNPNRSHFESMAIWHSADVSASTSSDVDGWIAKIAQKYGDPFCATNFGGNTPGALRGGEVILPSISNLDRFQLKLPDNLDKAYRGMLSANMDGRADELRKNTMQMLENTAKVQRGLSRYKPGSKYPDNNFSGSLNEIARMIAADVGPRVFYTSLGGFDTHAGQPEDHPALLETLSSALVAFRADIKAQGREDDVIVIGFSEFGRRLAENASAGTDHGKAGLMFALGKGIKGGLYGQYPDLEKLNDGDPVMTTDFRQVYAESLDQWLNVPSRDILGSSFKPLGFVK
jgi:uncharacterized protein (DUF1501 family)